ncbi:hypothetical protein PROFUN_16234, partial [Planoprotostelium fungivorum]
GNSVKISENFPAFGTNRKNRNICPINPTKYHKNRKMKNCLSAILDCPSLDHKKQPKHKDSQDMGSLQV